MNGLCIVYPSILPDAITFASDEGLCGTANVKVRSRGLIGTTIGIEVHGCADVDNKGLVPLIPSEVVGEQIEGDQAVFPGGETGSMGCVGMEKYEMCSAQGPIQLGMIRQ